MMRLRYTWMTLHGYLGAAGMIGTGLLLTCAVVWSCWLIPLHRSIVDATSLTRPPVTVSAAPEPTRAVAEPSLDEFYRQFPTTQSYMPSLSRLYGIARREGLSFTEGTYREVRETHGGFVHYELTFPVQGAYVQVRRFLRRTLTEFPTMALDRISFQRPAVDVGNVDVRLQFVWYLAGAP